MKNCPSHEQLRALLGDALGTRERQAVEGHVEECRLCEQALRAMSEPAPGVDWGRLAGIAPGAEEAPTFLRGFLDGATPASPGQGAGEQPETIDFPGGPTAQGPLGKLGCYHIVEQLGSGGFGFVFLAIDERLGCQVAIKVLKPELAASEIHKRRFLGEARAAAAVKHENVVAIHGVETATDFLPPYIVMEYVEGESLSARLKREKALPWREAAEIARQVALGLAAAHERNLVHRDVKPANVMLERGTGRAKITDFGLALPLEGDQTRLTQSGAIAGTLEYLSPEQLLDPTGVDERSDLYSLGAVLYELIAGEPPFHGPAHQVLPQLVHDDPAPPRGLKDKAPRELVAITLKCLAKKPPRRYRSAEELVDELGRLLAGEAVRARASTTWQRTTRWLRRRQAPAVLLVLLLAASGAAALLLALLLSAQRREEQLSATLREVTRREAETERERDRVERELASAKRDLALAERRGAFAGLATRALGGVADWKKAGAEVGWMRDDEFGGARFLPENQGGADDLPALRFSHWKEGVLAKLPTPPRAFGLYLHNTKVTDAGLKELAALKSLRALGLGGTEVTDAGLNELAPLNSLQSLSVDNTKVTDAGLKELAGLENLRALDLRFTKVTDAGLKEVAGLRGLQSLSLYGTKVTDARLKRLAVLPNLRALNVGGTEVTDAGLKDLAAVKSLRALNLAYTKVTDAGLKELAALTSLRALDLHDTKVTDAGLKDLAALQSLRALGLRYTKVTDAGLKELAALKGLQSLSLERTKVTDAGLKELAGLKSLQSLSLDDTKVTDAGLKELAGLKLNRLVIPRSAWTDLGLKHYLAAVEPPTTLDLDNTRVTDAGLKELATLESLQSLRLGGTRVTNAGLKELAALRSLQSLSLYGTRVTDAGLKELAALRSLQSLHLGDTRVTDAGLKELAALNSLQSLSLNNTKVAGAGLKELAALKSLRALSLAGTRVKDAGLEELAGLKSLRTLDVDRTWVTQEGLKQLRAALPDCEITR